MKLRKFMPAVVLLAMTTAMPATVYAADGSAPATAPVTSSQGLFVSGDVVMSGICQVAGQYAPGDMMVFRAQVLKSDGSTVDPAATTVTVNVVGHDPITMNYHGQGMWVGTYVIPPTAQPGALPYNITAQDSSGNKGMFVPLGMPPMIVGNTITITVDGKTVATLPKRSADTTVYLYPIIQLLKANGLNPTWNGYVLSVTVPGLPDSELPPAPSGSGPYSIVVNGKTIQRLTGHIEKDPYTHRPTTFLSTAVFELFQMAGGSFDGNTLSISTKPQKSSGQ